MAHLSDWQWALAAALLTAVLVLGGWWQRLQSAESQESPSSPDNSELQEAPEALLQLQQQLEQREAELQEAREEAELILLQLHQVQEELEHYFLESRDLQQKLDSRESQPGLDPRHLEQLQRIKARLVTLFAASAPVPADPRLLTLLQRQQNALRRFQRLHQDQR